MTSLNINYKVFTGEAFKTLLDDPKTVEDLTALHNLYSEWPYLVVPTTCADAQASTEAKFIPFKKFTTKKDGTIALAFDETTKKVIGIVAGYDLADGEARYKKAFTDGNLPEKTFHITHCIVAPEHRGKGVAFNLYNLFESAIKYKSQYNSMTLTVVERPDTFPHKKPDNAHEPFALFQKLGFAKLPESFGPGKYETEWKIVGTNETMANPMQFWIKPLKA